MATTRDQRRSGLNAKQRRFAEEYVRDHNATKAAIRAGYSEHTAAEIASRLLANIKIQDAVAIQHLKLSEKVDIRASDVLREIHRLATVDIGDILNFQGGTMALRKPNEIPERARRAISSVKVKRVLDGKGPDAQEVELIEFKLYDKRAALRDLAEYLGLTGLPAELYQNMTEAELDRIAAGEHPQIVFAARVAAQQAAETPPTGERNPPQDGNGGTTLH